MLCNLPVKNERPSTLGGPLRHDAANAAGRIFEVKAHTRSSMPANLRPEQEWRVWEQAKAGGGQDADAGVVSHVTNLVENPALVADRVLRHAATVDRNTSLPAWVAASAVGSAPTLPGPSCARLSKAPA